MIHEEFFSIVTTLIILRISITWPVMGSYNSIIDTNMGRKLNEWEENLDRDSKFHSKVAVQLVYIQVTPLHRNEVEEVEVQMRRVVAI